jgi:hypothetical protein
LVSNNGSQPDGLSRALQMTGALAPAVSTDPSTPNKTINPTIKTKLNRRISMILSVYHCLRLHKKEPQEVVVPVKLRIIIGMSATL